MDNMIRQRLLYCAKGVINKVLCSKFEAKIEYSMFVFEIAHFYKDMKILIKII